MTKPQKQVYMLCQRCRVLLPDYVPVANLGNGQMQKMLVKRCPDCGGGVQRFVSKEEKSQIKGEKQ
jgi:RNase P subunit RPR2